MIPRISDSRMVWLVVGLIAGLCISYFWPHEPALAVTGDRNDKFALVTSTTNVGGPEAVFVLDFLTGRLQGVALNQRTGKFSQSYYRNVAADFQVDPSSEPNYAIVSGTANLPSQGTATRATSVIYVAEMSSGKVAGYSFPYSTSNRTTRGVQMQPLDYFQFRQAMQDR